MDGNSTSSLLFWPTFQEALAPLTPKMGLSLAPELFLPWTGLGWVAASLRLGMAMIKEVFSLLPACLLASLLKFSALVEADKDGDVGLPFHHKTFLVLPAPAPLYLSR